MFSVCHVNESKIFFQYLNVALSGNPFCEGFKGVILQFQYVAVIKEWNPSAERSQKLFSLVLMTWRIAKYDASVS